MKQSRRGFIKLAAAVPLAQALHAQMMPREIAGTIRWKEAVATMDGFGASAAFHMAQNLRNYAEPQRSEILDLLFSKTKGAGLSIVRNIVGDGGSWGTPLNGPTPSIEPDEGKWSWTGDEEQVWFMKEAAARGCERNMSTVWSPPAWMKTNHSVIKGGLAPAKRQAFAEYLSAYVRGYKEHHGIDIYAISPTNEPDITVFYSSCYWSGEELRLFVRDNLAPVFARDGVKAKILVGEHSSWSEDPVLPSLNDPETAPKIDIVGVHAYTDSSGNPFPPISSRSGVLQSSSQQHKPIWMTEVSEGDTNMTEIPDGIYWAKLLHTHVVENGVTGWFYWWAISNADDRSALVYLDQERHTYVVAKRLFTIGNYSRFIRPGFVRLQLDMPTPHGVYLSAYKNTGTNQLVVVAINEVNFPQSVRLSLNGAKIQSLTPCRTSESENLATLQAVPVTDGSLSFRLKGASVTTFVGTVQPA